MPSVQATPLPEAFLPWDDETYRCIGLHHSGQNLTFIKELANGLKVFTESLRNDYDEMGVSTETAFGIGIRYDFNAKIM